MSSTNKTSLGLNMWEASDKPVRQDFVNDNVIINEKITKLNSDLTLRSLGNAIAREGWEVIASNLTMGNGIGVLFGRIKFIGTNTLVWGDVVGNFPNYESNYILPLLLFRTSGDLFLTAMVDTSGLIRVYNPDFSKIVTGADFHFQAIYVVKR